MKKAILAFGSNLGRRRDNIEAAAAALGRAGVVMERMSSYYSTSPVGGPPQGDFVNAAAVVRTELDPRGLLALAKKIEEDMGRDMRGVRFGPRPIDIDIIFFADITLDDPGLVIPHPRFAERLFVLAPLAEIEPGLVLPNGKTAAAFYNELKASPGFSLQSVEKMP